MRSLARPSLAACGLAVALVVAACGEPTAQVVEPENTRVRFELPAEYTDIGTGSEVDLGSAYGLPNSSLDDFSSDPVFFVATSKTGGSASFHTLRLLTTGGEFDPLDTSLDPLPNDTELLGYIEIAEPDVWGIRLRLAVGRGATDFQALVDRESDVVVLTQVVCTQACFLEQLELIDEIQGSWSLES